MTTLDLLRQRAPKLAAILNAADSDQLRRVSSSIAHAVVDRSGLTDPLTTEALEYLSKSGDSLPELQERIRSLAEKLDAQYFDLQELRETGEATEAEVFDAFAKARAVTAVACALGEVTLSSAAETAYEAVCAIHDSEEYFTAIAQSNLAR